MDLNDSELTLSDTFDLPLDTAEIISLLDLTLKDEISDFDLFADTLDTLILRSGNFACDCQDWVTDEYDETRDLGKYGYFIEPFNSEIELYEGFGIFGNRIELIGTSYFDNDRHMNTKLSDTIRVFKYLSYKVLTPATVYGPLFHTGKREIPSDPEELILRSQITIEN